MDIVTRLRSLQADRNDMDQLVELLTAASQLASTYGSVGMVVPDWLGDATLTLKREIADRRRDALLKERKLIEANERKLMSRDEKRAELEKRKAKIDELLGIGGTGSGVGQPAADVVKQ